MKSLYYFIIITMKRIKFSRNIKTKNRKYNDLINYNDTLKYIVNKILIIPNLT